MIRSAFTNRFIAITFVVFVIFLLATVTAWKITFDVVNQEEKSRFYQDAYQIKELIQTRINLYILALHGLDGFVKASDTVRPDEWSTYIKQAKLLKQYPGISAISYVTNVQKDTENAFLSHIRKEYPSFTIHPKTKRSEYFIITYIEPLLGREEALGFDLGSEEKRRIALEKSRISGDIASTGRIIAVTNNKPAFGLLVPTYQVNKIIHGTETERKNNLKGFIYATFRGEKMFQSVLGKPDLFPNLDIEIYDSENLSKDHLLFDHDPNHIISNSHLTTRDTIKIDRQTWIILICNKNHPALTKSQEYLPTIVLASGLGFSFLFLGLFLHRFRQHIAAYNKSTTPKA